MVTLSLPWSLAIWKYSTQQTEMMQNSLFLEAVKGKVLLNKLGRAARCRVWSLLCAGLWDTAPEPGLGSGDAGWAGGGSSAPKQLWSAGQTPFSAKVLFYCTYIVHTLHEQWVSLTIQVIIRISYNMELWFAPQTPSEHAIHIWITTSSTSWGKILPKHQVLVKLFLLKTSCTSPLISLWQELGQCLLLLQPVWGVWNISCHAVKQNNCTSI